jgi:hypothetical protein
MSLKALVGGAWLAKQEVAIIPPATYLVAGSPYTIFTITGGPVLVDGIFGVVGNGAGLTLANFRVAVGGVNVCAATVCLAGVGTLLTVPLDDTGVLPIIPGIAAGTYPDPAAFLAGDTKVLAAPGIITLVVAVNAEDTVQWYCAYHRMSPAALIA